MVYMQCLAVVLLSSLVAGQFTAIEHDQDLSLWEKEGWKIVKRTEPFKNLEFQFALKQSNLRQFEDLFWDVSNPKSMLYGQYKSIEEITHIVKPSAETHRVITEWLKSYGVEDCMLNRNEDFLKCTINCATAEKLLTGAVFYYFKHEKLTKPVIRSPSRYYLPDDVARHLDFVGGVHRFPAVNWAKTKSEGGVNVVKELQKEENVHGIHVGVYPKVLRERYNVTAQDVGSHPENIQGVAQFLEQFFHQADLSEFMTLFVGSEFVHLNEIAKVIGPDSGRSGIEASLDTQYIMGMGANITTWFWSTGGRHESQEPFLEWMVAMGNTTVVPIVHSVSYGDVESSLSTTYMQRVNTEFMKAGVRGVTLLFASGDDGAACKNKKFSPNFPASSPYVTTVGGTGFNNPFSVTGEFAYEISGGGFSNVFKRPSYQNDLVEKYFKSGKVPPQQYFNEGGRGYPDIAAICRHFWIVNNRIPVPGVMGTSASTPTVAGIISLLNDIRLHSNKPAMGFLNPFIYQHADLLYDVTSGCNEGCLSGDKGFCAVSGWDPVTGSGTPNFAALSKAAMQVFQK